MPTKHLFNLFQLAVGIFRKNATENCFLSWSSSLIRLLVLRFTISFRGLWWLNFNGPIKHPVWKCVAKPQPKGAFSHGRNMCFQWLGRFYQFMILFRGPTPKKFDRKSSVSKPVVSGGTIEMWNFLIWMDITKYILLYYPEIYVVGFVFISMICMWFDVSCLSPQIQQANSVNFSTFYWKRKFALFSLKWAENLKNRKFSHRPLLQLFGCAKGLIQKPVNYIKPK